MKFLKFLLVIFFINNLYRTGRGILSEYNNFPDDTYG